MSLRETNNIRQSRQLGLASLRVDSLRAWRQSEDAVILPISYEFSEVNHCLFNNDSAIVPIQWPLPNLEKPTRKQKLALLKQKVESARQRAAKAVQAQRQANPIPIEVSQSSSLPNRIVSISVLILLASVIVMVVCAWACFR